MARINLVVLFSGEGSNLENLIRHFHHQTIDGRTIHIIPITNRPDAKGIERAARYGIETRIIDHRAFASREAFDAHLAKMIISLHPHLVVLAGFMRILTPIFTSQVKAINLHPSLLPLFKGAHAIQESFASGMKVGGVTIHRVSELLDSGEILAQQCVTIDPDDTLETFTQKIHAAEHTLLPRVVRTLLAQSPQVPATAKKRDSL